MPNWCHNLLTVRGEPAEITAFTEKARVPRAAGARLYEQDAATTPFEDWFAAWRASHPLSFEPFVPSPADSAQLVGCGREKWAEEHWGTKWDAFFHAPAIVAYPGADPETSLASQGIIATPGVLVYTFLTAWSPPKAAVAAMASQHPGLEFVLRYAEYGEDFAGENRYTDGHLVAEETISSDDAFAAQDRWF